MAFSWLSAADRQFMLLGMSTLTVAEPMQFTGLHGALRLLFVGTGTCQVRHEGGTYPLAGDRMLLIAGEQRYEICQPSEDLLLSQVDFSHMACMEGGFSLAQLAAQYPGYREYGQRLPVFHCFHDRLSLVRFAAKSLTTYAGYAQPGRNQYLATTLACLVASATCGAPRASEADTQSDNRHIRRAIEYMNENYMCAITAEDIAAYVGVHAGHLHRLFRLELGTRVTEYLTALRLKKAKALLKRTDIPIHTVSELTGISTQQYLSRLFRQHVGMTPQAYRRSYNITCNYGAAKKHYETVDYGTQAAGDGA